MEESLVRSGGSNGSAARALQDCEGQTSGLLLALEERSGVKIDPRMFIVTFMLEYATYLMNRLERGMPRVHYNVGRPRELLWGDRLDEPPRISLSSELLQYLKNAVRHLFGILL